LWFSIKSDLVDLVAEFFGDSDCAIVLINGNTHRLGLGRVTEQILMHLFEELEVSIKHLQAVVVVDHDDVSTGHHSNIERILICVRVKQSAVFRKTRVDNVVWCL